MRICFFIIALILSLNANAKDFYLFYSGSSENLDELGISAKEVRNVFEGEFGPASDELPKEVKFEDFYVAKYPDKSFVFTLKAPFNCGQLGCNNVVFERDKEGDLVEKDSKTPVKCKIYDSDKVICMDGGYKPEVKKAPKKRKILHFYPPEK